MKSVLRYYLLLFILPAFEAGMFRCDYTYFPEVEGWFKLHPDANTWSEASFRCNLEGAHLAIPMTEEISDVMLSLIYDDNDTMAVHSGIHTIENMRKFVKEEGIDQTWIVQTYVLTRNGTYRQASERDLYPFICHRAGGASVELNECGTVDSQYVLDSRTNHCYKFHRFRQTFNRAMMVCEAEGGHLAIINSAEEAEVIRDIWANNPYYTIPGIEFKDVAFLGVLYTDLWSTIQGQTLSEAGYSEFSPGEPNNARGDEFCGSVGRNGKLFDDPCTRPIPFICEKEPKTSCDVQTTDKEISEINSVLPINSANSDKRRQHKYSFNDVLKN